MGVIERILRRAAQLMEDAETGGDIARSNGCCKYLSDVCMDNLISLDVESDAKSFFGALFAPATPVAVLPGQEPMYDNEPDATDACRHGRSWWMITTFDECSREIISRRILALLFAAEVARSEGV